jgi:hypothetical protein
MHPSTRTPHLKHMLTTTHACIARFADSASDPWLPTIMPATFAHAPRVVCAPLVQDHATNDKEATWLERCDV